MTKFQLKFFLKAAYEVTLVFLQFFIICLHFFQWEFMPQKKIIQVSTFSNLVGYLIIIIAFIILLFAIKDLGRNLSPFPKPINAKVIGNYVVSKANSVGYTIGYTFNNNEIGYSLFIGHNFSDKISTFIELYGFNDQLNIDAGLAYLIQDKLQFDAYFGTGLNNKMVFASVGLSYLYLK